MASNPDVLVIGAGPAGLSAAREVAAAGLVCVCIDRLGPGGELINIGVLHDCPDLPMATGAELLAELADTATASGVELAIGEVRELRAEADRLLAVSDEIHAARAVILATGLMPGTLGVEGEEDYEGNGLSHCASCDGPLYAGERVIVAGGDEWALREALDLATTAAHVGVIGPEDAVASGERAARLAALPNVTLMAGRIVGLRGANGLEAVIVEHGTIREALSARAVFVQTDRRAATSFAASLLAVDADGRVRVDADGRTSHPHIYAAGNVGAGAIDRVSAAIADGRRVGLAVARMLGDRTNG